MWSAGTPNLREVAEINKQIEYVLKKKKRVP